VLNLQIDKTTAKQSLHKHLQHEQAPQTKPGKNKSNSNMEIHKRHQINKNASNKPRQISRIHTKRDQQNRNKKRTTKSAKKYIFTINA
jgi:hypothetical protein